MDVPPINPVFQPATAGRVLVMLSLGIALGTVSGLVPGLHANTFALMLASMASSLPGPPRVVGATLLAAGVVHTFLDVVPTLTLGVPDPAMAATALPGHKLVLGGRGTEALRLSVLGSAIAFVSALVLAIPVTWFMTNAYESLQPFLPVVLGVVATILVLTEPTRWAKLGALLSMTMSALLGITVLDLPANGVIETGTMLAPAFAGLFGAPILLDARHGAGVPPQREPTLAMTPGAVTETALLGTLGGAIVGYLPGMSSGIAATMVLLPLSGTSTRRYVVATSSVNTANLVFALCALLAIGTPRTGVLVAVKQADVPLAVPLLVGSTALAATAGVLLVLLLGDRYLRVVGQLDPTTLSWGVLGFLTVLSVVLAGPIGLGVFLGCSLVGRLPVYFGARRITLMGILLGPLLLGL
jgi:putative membrane protein